MIDLTETEQSGPPPCPAGCGCRWFDDRARCQDCPGECGSYRWRWLPFTIGMPRPWR